jgi:AcrR family transcriptional regulator
MGDRALPVRLAEPNEEAAEAGRAPQTNRRGQLLGGKGQRTRLNIVNETLDMLAAGPLGEVTMANVTKRLGLNAAAFYRYFKDIGEVLVEALDRLTQDTDALLPLVEKDWPTAEIHPHALAFVDAYFDLWRRHAPLIRARNSLADAGDPRFVACRREAARALTVALTQKLEPAIPLPSTAASPYVMASLLMTVVERTATVTEHGRYADVQSWSDLRIGLAEMVEDAILRRRN